MNFISSVFRFFAATLVGCLALSQISTAQESRTIPWTAGGTYSWTAVDEDIRLMLRRVIQADGKLRPIIKPEVKGSVTVQFRNVPLAAAFNQLIQENNLDFAYNSQNGTVTVFAKSRAPKAKVTRRDFLSPEVVTFDDIRRSLTAFRLGVEGVTFDAATNTISIVGTEERISDIKRLVERLDASAKKKRALDEARAARSRAQTLKLRKARAAGLKAQAEQKKARALQAQAAFQEKLYASFLDFKTKVIRLRFATVGSTQKKFQNRTFTVPGIEETLQKILGLPVTGTASATPSQAQAAVDRLRTLLPGQLPGQRIGIPKSITPYTLPSSPTAPQLPVAALADIFRPVISTDPRTNSVIVRGTSEAIAEIEKIIRELDKPLEMVEIEVVIVKADSNVSEELGIRYRGATQSTDRSRAAAVDSGVTGGTETAATSGLDAATLLPAVTGGGIVSSFILRAGDTFLQAELVALAQKNRLQVVSSPRVVTLDNVTARVTQSRNLFFQTQASGDSGQVLQEVETGLELTILPSIIPSTVAGDPNLIRLQLTARKSDPQAAQTGGSVDVDSAEVQTQVLVPDGGTFVMAGLFDDTRRENESGIPFLKDIPLLGALFRDNLSSDRLIETIFFLTPRIVDQARLTRDIAARVGTREYMKRKRSNLSRISRGIETDKSRIFPNVLRTLEEDE
jgi:type II secretory pathway component GspD/PulD (secretin)